MLQDRGTDDVAAIAGEKRGGPGITVKAKKERKKGDLTLSLVKRFCGWWSSVTQAHKLAPPGMGATAQGLLEGIHWGLGMSVGSLLGGVLYSQLGAVPTFYIAAGSLYEYLERDLIAFKNSSKKRQ